MSLSNVGSNSGWLGSVYLSRASASSFSVYSFMLRISFSFGEIQFQVAHGGAAVVSGFAFSSAMAASSLSHRLYAPAPRSHLTPIRALFLELSRTSGNVRTDRRTR